MGPFFGDLDAAEHVASVGAGELVVVARHENDAGALARLAEDLLHDVVVTLRPVPRPAQLPAVYDVADEEQRFALHGTEKVEQGVRLAARRAQMQIGDPDRPDPKQWGSVALHEPPR